MSDDLSPCDVYRLWPDADARLKGTPEFSARNHGGPKGFDTFSKVWAVVDDPLSVPGCQLCLCKFLDGSPVAIRYPLRDIIQRGSTVSLEDQSMLRAEMEARIAEEDDPNLCRCGSGEEKYPLHDSYGIFVAYVCSRCEDKVRARYRPEIFAGPYEADEPIEPEDY